MDKKRILIISRSFYPDNSPRAFRTTELAKELSRQGHDVIVCFPTKGQDYSNFETENNLKIKNLGTLKWKPIELKGGKLELIVRRVIRRSLLMLFEWPDIELMFKVSRILKTESGYDLLISIAAPHQIHWGVARARKSERKIAKCWIADCGDPYMGSTLDSFRKLFYFKYFERWFCRKADFLTIPFDGAKSAYYPEYHDKIRIIPQGFQLDKLNIPKFMKVFNYPVFAYAGGFVPGKRDPRALIEFLSQYDKMFKFIVYTNQPEILTPFRKTLNEKLEIKEVIPREELLTVLSRMDFLINLDNNSDTQLPSKLIDYSFTGRPVLNITSGMNFSTLQKFMEGDYSKRMILESSTNYDIVVVANKFISLLDS